MNSRILINVVLALILAGLVMLVIYEPGKEIPPAKTSLTSLEPKAIKTIVIEQPEQLKIVLQKTDAGWQMQEPLQITANNTYIDNLLAIATSKSHSRYLASKVDLNQFKLISPDLKISLDDTVLSFGTTDPLHGFRYVLLDNQVHLITDRYTHLIRGKMSALISPALLPSNIMLTRLVLPEVTLQSDKNGWSAQPDSSLKSADQIQKLVDEWKYARAMQVTRETDLDKLSANEEKSTIDIHTSNGVFHFNLKKQQDEIILIRPDKGLNYHFDNQTGERLLHLPEIESTPVKSSTDTTN